jgi:hypothetical protein
MSDPWLDAEEEVGLRVPTAYAIAQWEAGVDDDDD